MSAQYLYPWPSSGTPKYHVDNDWIYEMTGRPAFFIQRGWVYTVSGQPVFWIDDRHMYPHGKAGRPAFAKAWDRSVSTTGRLQAS
jgi:hypothetical protein